MIRRLKKIAIFFSLGILFMGNFTKYLDGSHCVYAVGLGDENLFHPSSKTAVVGFSVDETEDIEISYTISVPKSYTLRSEDNQSAKNIYYVTTNNFSGYTLNVEVNDFLLTNRNGKGNTNIGVKAYTFIDGDSEDRTNISIKNDVNNQAAICTLVPDEQIRAGHWRGNLEYTISITPTQEE